MAESGSLRIGRFHAEYHAGSGLSAEAVRARFDSVVRTRLPAALAQALTPWLDGQGNDVILVRELAVPLVMGAEWDLDQVAQAWAGEIAQALAGARDGVVRFSDPAAYLGKFLVDVVAGEAWGRWYYARFDGLRMLTPSAAVRTAVADDPELGVRALLALRDTERRRVIEALTPNDARRLLDRLASGTEDSSATDGWQALDAAWEALPPHSPGSEHEAGVALELFLCAWSPASGGALLAARARALAHLARVLADEARLARRLVAALGSRRIDELHRIVRDGADVLAPLCDAPSGWVERVARSLAPASATNQRATAEPVRTAFGGVFLLLPFLMQLPLEEATAGWPAAGDTPAAAALRLILLNQALGVARGGRIFRDPLVRDLAGVAPALTPGTVARWAARLPTDSLAQFVAAIAASSRTEGRARGETLALHAVRARSAPVALLVDCQLGVWLWARGYAAGHADRAVTRAAGWMREHGWTPARLVADAPFAAELQADALAATLLDMNAGGEQLEAADPDAAVVLARRGRIAADLAYLAAPALGLARPARLAFAVAAQGILRAFAARLSGLQTSSLPYLYASFLDVRASVEVEAGRWIAQIGRPPLQFLLARSGAARGEHRPPWLDGLTIALAPESG